MIQCIKIDKRGRVIGFNGEYEYLLGHGMEVFVACVQVAKEFEKDIVCINDYNKESKK